MATMAGSPMPSAAADQATSSGGRQQQQCTRDYACPDVYACILVTFPDLQDALLDEKACTGVLTKALTQLHGAVGGAIPWRLLHLTSPAIGQPQGQPARGAGPQGVSTSGVGGSGGGDGGGSGQRATSEAAGPAAVAEKTQATAPVLWPGALSGQGSEGPAVSASAFLAAHACAPEAALGASSAVMLVKASRRDLDKLWTACSCMTTYDNYTCRLQVISASPFLSSFAVDPSALLMGLHSS